MNLRGRLTLGAAAMALALLPAVHSGLAAAPQDSYGDDSGSNEPHFAVKRHELKIRAPLEVSPGVPFVVQVNRALKRESVAVLVVPVHCPRKRECFSSQLVTTPRNVVTSNRRRAKFLVRLADTYEVYEPLNGNSPYPKGKSVPYKNGQRVKIQVISIDFDSVRKGKTIIGKVASGHKGMGISIP